jgi:hypothetical protein
MISILGCINIPEWMHFHKEKNGTDKRGRISVREEMKLI